MHVYECIYVLYKRKINAKRVAYSHQTFIIVLIPPVDSEGVGPGNPVGSCGGRSHQGLPHQGIHASPQVAKEKKNSTKK